ncbi:MAG TPA: sulfate transporter CysZ [Gammaproteobacteria bacterium]|nr:sulfate transporter CysZ [Gammaproteobacteria bacterium]
MIKDLITGTGYIFRGFKLIRTPGLRRFVAIPFLINLVLFSTAIWWGYHELDQYLLNILPGWLDWLSWLLMPLFSLAALIMVFYTFTLVANLIGSPFNAVLAEKVERKLGGHPVNQESSLRELASGSVKSIFAEIRKLAYLALWAIPLLILFLIPGINLIAPFAWGLFSAWMLALEYSDYAMGNHQLSFQQERQLLRKNKTLAWGFGGGMLFLTLIPILNFFAMPVGVAGGTILWIERLKPDA